MNLFVNMVNDHGIQSYMVLPRNPEKASFLNRTAPLIDLQAMLTMCTADDVIIDGWQLDEICDATQIAPARRKVFWYHGCSVPIGKGYQGEAVYSPRSCYTHYWNVSTACALYVSQRYGVESSVMPLFAPEEPAKLYSQGMGYNGRKGVLVLWARGAWRILRLLPRVSPDTVTVIYPGYDESRWYEMLSHHRMFVSVDQGIGSTPLWRRVQYRLFGKELNYWKTPKSRLLGFPTPPFEAALCGCVVVGAAMGGGLDWMNGDNCFMAEDLNLDSLVEQVTLALEANDEYMESKAQAAFQAASRFTKERAWTKLCELLDL
ncbi:MAG: hypothetical protein CL611_05645 [Anaerolineaceae bacterium]|nr:hypothetical protein [Anaerolineaceae bacterium]